MNQLPNCLLSSPTQSLQQQEREKNCPKWLGPELQAENLIPKVILVWSYWTWPANGSAKWGNSSGVELGGEGARHVC